MENKLFVAFGGITILSGIYFLTIGKYLEGICGVSVGAWLVYLNLKKINDKTKK